jgi:hypothetical protein
VLPVVYALFSNKTKVSYKNYVDKIKHGVSYNRVIQEARTMSEKHVTRLNLLTKKDLRFLASKHKLDGERHKSDIVSVDIKVAEWNRNGQNVFIFKKSGESHSLHGERFC